MFDLLTDPLIPTCVDGRADPDSLSLPAVFRELATDRVDQFPGLAPHQRQPFYQFLAQVGAIALHLDGRRNLPADEQTWRNLLAAIAPDHASTAWSLVVEDAGSPAFLQPPTRRFEDFRASIPTPDGLDLPVTAKNHDRKRELAVHATPDLWLNALLALQTAQGYSGRGQQGIARMNGGLSSRVLVDRRPDSRWGRRVSRAIRMLLHRRDEVLGSVPHLFRPTGGLALTWLRPWDDDASLSPEDLDPYFVEVCRRVRLTLRPDGGIVAHTRPSNLTRIGAKALKGHLGDPWVPLDQTKGEGVALTVSSRGLDYRLVQRVLLSGTTKRPLSLKLLPDETGQDAELHLQVLVRGQGKTEGLHERVIPLPHSVAEMLDVEDQDGESASLADLSEKMVGLAGKARKVLRQSILVYLQGPENPSFQKKDADADLVAYDRTVDASFFHHLFTAPVDDFDAAYLRWEEHLKREAVEVARSSWRRRSPPRARREKALAAAEAVLYGGLRKHLPGAFPTSDDRRTTS